MSKQSLKNAATNHLHCFGGSDSSTHDVSSIAGVLKSGRAVVATVAVTAAATVVAF